MRRKVRWRRPRPRIARLAPTPPLPADWAALCKAVRRRDRGVCRFCGRDALNGQGAVDHLLPRQLAPALVADPANLCLLCCIHHGGQKKAAEAALYSFAPGPLLDFFRVIGPPIPSASAVQAAFRRVLELSGGRDEL